MNLKMTHLTQLVRIFCGRSSVQIPPKMFCIFFGGEMKILRFREKSPVVSFGIWGGGGGGGYGGGPALNMEIAGDRCFGILMFQNSSPSEN